MKKPDLRVDEALLEQEQIVYRGQGKRTFLKRRHLQSQLLCRYHGRRLFRFYSLDYFQPDVIRFKINRTR